MGWVRGDTIGRGSFGTVNLAISDDYNCPLFVVKSSAISNSNSLINEKRILSELGNHHPNVIHFLGDSLSSESGTHFYNLFLEYAHNGSLADHLRISGGKFDLSQVKTFTKSILEGLCYVHDQGFVHCDVKLQNILLFSNGVVKIADFGLAKRIEDNSGCELRGTPFYMSPEIISGGEGDSAADIWALGCIVVEMISGKTVWDLSPGCDVNALLYRIGVVGELPLIPCNLCCEGKDFVNKCFIKDPNERWTARMLLDHPFLSRLEDPCCSDDYDHVEPASVSPRCPFQFPDLEGIEEECSSCFNGSESFDSGRVSGVSEIGFRDFISSRLKEDLISDGVIPDWNDADAWISVR